MKKIVVLMFLIPIIGFSQNKKELTATINRLKTDSTKLKETVDKKMKDINSLLESIDKLKKQYESEKSELNSKIESQNLNNIQIKKINKKYEDSLSSYISYIKAILKPEFEEINIGSQIWMKKNLDVSTFRNGDIIPQITSNEEWKAALENKKPAWCYYNNIGNGDKYGKIYNHWAVHDQRGLAPKGWHIPSKTEFQKLAKHYSEVEDYENIGESFMKGYLHCFNFLKEVEHIFEESNDAFIELIKAINRLQEACSYKEINYNQKEFMGYEINVGYNEEDNGEFQFGREMGDFSAFKMLTETGGFNLSFGGFRKRNGEFEGEYQYDALHSINPKDSSQIGFFGAEFVVNFDYAMHFPNMSGEEHLHVDARIEYLKETKEWSLFHLGVQFDGGTNISESAYVRCIKD